MRLLLLLLLYTGGALAQQKTFCNPVNIDYGYTPFDRFTTNGKHRTTADPVIVNLNQTYYLFSTNQEGYWWSDNMLNWNYIHKNFLRDNKYTHDLNAPGVFAINGVLYVYGSTHEADFPIYKSTNPKANHWEMVVDTLHVGAWDPAFFYDEDLKRLFLYWGSSNIYPLQGTYIDFNNWQSIGYVKNVASLSPEEHGWERFGEYNDNVFLLPFIEGASMNKYNGKYYLQYGAPGTEFSGYADGVMVSNKPLDGFKYQSHNPFSYKPGGFVRGAGHGTTYQDNFKNWWHVSTSVVCSKDNFERRIGIWPAGFDKDDVMYCNTAYGDYPTYIPEYAQNKDFTKGLFAGWMLLNYQKPVTVSSTLGAFNANLSVDEDIKTYWSARTAGSGEYLQSDLGEVSIVNAIQVNYADQDVEFKGKSASVFHQYKIEISLNNKKWEVLVDKSKNMTDIPHDYIELKNGIEARYVKITNLRMPTGKFALSGFRVFGKGGGEAPAKVENLTILRTPPHKNGNRAASWIKWRTQDRADGYVIYFGKSPDKLYGSIMVYGRNDYYFTAMDVADAYYFQIEAFNGNGISERSKVIESE